MSAEEVAAAPVDGEGEDKRKYLFQLAHFHSNHQIARKSIHLKVWFTFWNQMRRVAWLKIWEAKFYNLFKNGVTN